MADGKVFTGALGVIRVNGTPIAKVRNIRWTENVNRGDVRGVGTILTSEAPALTWGGSVSMDFYETDFATTGLPGAIKRFLQTNQDFEDQLLLDYDGIQLDIFKKELDVIDPATGLKKPKAVPYATLRHLLIESDGADLTEGAISGHSQTYRYLGPVLRPA